MNSFPWFPFVLKDVDKDTEYDLRLKDNSLIENCRLISHDKFIEMMDGIVVDISQIKEIRRSFPTSDELLDSEGY